MASSRIFAVMLAAAITPSIAKAEFIQPLVRTQLYGSAQDVEVLSVIDMSLEMKQAYEQEFLAHTYFAAFAVSKDMGFGYSTGSHTLEAAHEMAMAQCLSVNTQCRIIAQIVPQGYAGAQDGVVTLSPEVAEFFRRRNSYDTYRAMAVSAIGAYAAVWSHPTQAAADAAALSDCEGYRTGPEGLRDMPCILIPDFPQ